MLLFIDFLDFVETLIASVTFYEQRKINLKFSFHIKFAGTDGEPPVCGRRSNSFRHQSRTTG